MKESPERKRFRLRIERIKQVPFLEAFDKVALGVDYECSRLPYHIPCPLPDHYEKSGSFYIQKHRWWCFGCSRGGDVIDFAQHYLEISKFPAVIRHVEGALGIESPEGDGAELALKAAMIRMEATGDPSSEWNVLVWGINDDYVDRVRPYMRHGDSTIADRAWSVSESVYGFLDSLLGHVPLTARRAREEIRKARGLVIGHARGIERDVETWTGKDRLDVALEVSVVPDLIEGLGARLIEAIEMHEDPPR